MKVSASINNRPGSHHVNVETNGVSKTISISPKPDGLGSSINGAEFLLVSIATCFCNDIYREAAKRMISIHEVNVTATAEFGGEGEPGTNFLYKAEVKANASDTEISELIKHVNEIAEIHKTIRMGVEVKLIELV